METITSFRGKYGFLSNFYHARVKYLEFYYPTVEHAYQAAKSDDKSLRRVFTHASTPSTAKKMGKSVPLRPDWEEVKFAIMEELLRQKFSKPNLAQALLATGDAELIEENWWHDEVWGVCNGKGMNALGKLLMKIREELKHGPIGLPQDH